MYWMKIFIIFVTFLQTSLLENDVTIMESVSYYNDG